MFIKFLWSQLFILIIISKGSKIEFNLMSHIPTGNEF
jgi:hypothetical protein